jgi:hypothetical protein
MKVLFFKENFFLKNEFLLNGGYLLEQKLVGQLASSRAHGQNSQHE